MIDEPGKPGLTPDDPAYWDEFYNHDERRPPGWAEASARQRCVLYHAAQQEPLSNILASFVGDMVDGPVMVEVGQLAHSGDVGAEFELRAGQQWMPQSDASILAAAVPEFAAVVSGLIASGVAEIRRTPSDESHFDDADPFPADQVDAILADPASWLDGADTGEAVRIALTNRSRKRALSGSDLDQPAN